MFRRYLIANWKMNLPPGGVLAYLDAVAAAPAGDVQVVIAPPFPYLRDVSSHTRVGVSSQNCADRDKGAFTGEVAPSMVRDCGAHYAIVGHSERRQIYGESDALVGRKVAAAAAAGLVPILCVGEELRTRDAGQVATFLAGQLRAVAEAGLDHAGDIVIAYEPIWAIGTGRNASGLMIAETVALIRDALKRFWPPRFGTTAPILYGGSVTPENVSEMETSGNVDGYLVGGASLDSTKFRAILRAMQKP
jgi:triosephosphate isomerase (TIM)